MLSIVAMVMEKRAAVYALLICMLQWLALFLIWDVLTTNT
jgi:hypothetical protein